MLAAPSCDRQLTAAGRVQIERLGPARLADVDGAGAHDLPLHAGAAHDAVVGEQVHEPSEQLAMAWGDVEVVGREPRPRLEAHPEPLQCDDDVVGGQVFELVEQALVVVEVVLDAEPFDARAHDVGEDSRRREPGVALGTLRPVVHHPPGDLVQPVVGLVDAPEAEQRVLVGPLEVQALDGGEPPAGRVVHRDVGRQRLWPFARGGGGAEGCVGPRANTGFAGHGDPVDADRQVRVVASGGHRGEDLYPGVEQRRVDPVVADRGCRLVR